MIDAYDILDIDLSADDEKIKKAFKRASLMYHPDKAKTSGLSSEVAQSKFLAVKEAEEILSDADRRKVYDTFGIDLGKEKPDMEVWSLGMESFVGPIGTFAFKSIVMRLVLWTISWTYVQYLILLLAAVVAILYGLNVEIRQVKLKSQDGLPFIIGAGLAAGIVVVVWIWQLLGDAVGIFYLASEVVDLQMLIENWKFGLGAAVLSFVLSWLIQNWWWWIVGLQVLLVVIAFIAVAMASQLVSAWIDHTQKQHGDKLKQWRLGLRRSRKELQDEVEKLRQKVERLEEEAKKPGNGQKR